MPGFLSRVSPVAEDATDSARSRVASGWQDHAPWSSVELLRFHYADIRAARDASLGPGYLIAVIRHEDEFVGAGCVTLGDRNASHTLVVGSHPRTDLCLGADPAVALRHLMLRITLATERRPLIRILDLRSGPGFVIEGVGTCTAALSDGEVTVRLGSYALMCLPLPPDKKPWPDSSDQALDEMPRSVVRDFRSLEAPGSLAAGLAEPPSVMLLPGVTVLPGGGPQAAAGEIVATVTIQGPDGESVHPLTCAQLEHGVLVGPYQDKAAGIVEPRNAEAVARVHLLLLREGEDYLAIDVASTNSILINTLETRVGRLAARCTIELGAGNVARWQLAHPSTQHSLPGDLQLN